MKKSVVYLGIAFVAFVNVSLASVGEGNYPAQLKVESVIAGNPLLTAVRLGDLKTVKKFVEYGMDVNTSSDGMSALMVAARYNKTEIIQFLLDNGARLNDKDEFGFNALKYAELSNATEAVQILKDKAHKK